ncbi:NUDIX domain-containing protein [Arthrobacter koreensis]|uniref:NUDIX domain-containing protein n=1 Tax=Arthrobacter koreensis TaxID=199136 RepID=UPI0036DAB24C
MTIEPPAPGEPRRPHGPRDAGDAWVVAPDGQRYWGRFGAAGLLACDPGRGILLQHRVSWSHHGGTWALPGGARHQGESALDAALRESTEEAGVPPASLRPRFMSVLDLGIWSYATLMADVEQPFDPVISDQESVELAWVAPENGDGLPLHPAFAEAWQRLRPLLGIRPALVVDAANLVGTVPDGWWKDRAAAAERILEALAGRGPAGMPADLLGLPEDLWYPEITVVLEGRARTARATSGLEIIRAEGSGDDAVVEAVRRLAAEGRTVSVATSDRALAETCRALGAHVAGAGELRTVLEP